MRDASGDVSDTICRASITSRWEDGTVTGYFAHHMELLGYHDLDRKPAFKLAMQVVNDRWYLYLAHFWEPGWSILDVTDPTHPNKIGEMTGPANTWTLQVQVADGKMVTSLERILPGWGGTRRYRRCSQPAPHLPLSHPRTAARSPLPELQQTGRALWAAQSAPLSAAATSTQPR